MNECKVIALTNQKGGVGKTTSTVNLGIGLAKQGKRVLLIDNDPQASMTLSLGFKHPDDLFPTVTDVMNNIMDDGEVTKEFPVIKSKEGVDVLSANLELCGIELRLVNEISREQVLKTYVDTIRKDYDYILIDCMPSLGMLTINALAAADNVVVPVQAAYLPAKGLEQLLQTINKVKRQINPKLKIEGILLTMVDNRTNYAKDIAGLIRETYGDKIKVFDTEIPQSVRAAEIAAEGTSIYKHDPKGKVAEGYRALTKEVIADGEKRRKHQLDQLR